MMRACEACYRSKERCEVNHHQQLCSRCFRLCKVCHPRTRKRLGRPPIVKKFDYGTSGTFSYCCTNSSSQYADLDQSAIEVSGRGTFTHATEDRLSESQKAFRQELAINQIHGIHSSPPRTSCARYHNKDGFFQLHRHWLIAKSLSRISTAREPVNSKIGMFQVRPVTGTLIQAVTKTYRYNLEY